MALFKCKMCGGSLEVTSGETIIECEYCGTQQTLPKTTDENVQSLFNRANLLRQKSEFDKAEAIYEKILVADETESEAYWGVILCKFGIEYVEDPTTFKRIPTCHRTSYDSIIADEYYKKALEHADATQRAIYEREAKQIDEIQKGILAISAQEEPYDVFICYKESDADGKRTQDSVIANDIYHHLTTEGFKVFYAAITLEDKLGSAYEPIIFAALNSSKVMLSIGTKPEYFNAVWVKNEWSRFLKMMKNDRSKMLIPCYKGMDAYELPEEFAHLQAQDMGKIGFINDIVRGIKKVIVKDEPKTTVVKETVVTTGNINTAPLLKRAFMFLEDGEWGSADEYCEKVLDIDPENAQAYLAKLMVELKVRRRESLKVQAVPFDGNKNYQKALRFADEKLKAEIVADIEHINTRNENARLDGIYKKAKETMASAKSEFDYKDAASKFETISEYQDSAALAKECCEKAETARKDGILYRAKSQMIGESISRYEDAIKLLEPISDWKNAAEMIGDCKKKIEEIHVQEEAKRLERERKEEIARREAKKRAKRGKLTAITVLVVLIAAIAAAIVYTTVIAPNNKYNNAVALMDEGKYPGAIAVFEALDGYKDSAAKIKDVQELWVALCRATISAGSYHTVGVKSDGTVVAVGKNNDGQCDVSDWTDIIAVAAGAQHTVGLKSNGTVVATGYSRDGRCIVSDWTDIVAIAAGDKHTLGLKSDGTVVAIGSNVNGQCNVIEWADIVAITAGANHSIGLKRDGTVVVAGSNTEDQCDVRSWTDIVVVAAGRYHTVGVKSDGIVVAVGSSANGKLSLAGKDDIVAVAAGGNHTVSLRKDGVVGVTGSNDYGQRNVSDWTNIVAVTAGNDHTVGLKSDGTVVATGNNEYGQCDVSDWTNIKTH